MPIFGQRDGRFAVVTFETTSGERKSHLQIFRGSRHCSWKHSTVLMPRLPEKTFASE